MPKLHMLPTNDADGVFRATAANTLLRAYASAIPAAGPAYHGASAFDIVEWCGQRAGKDILAIKRSELITWALHTSSEFPSILGLAVEQALQSGFNSVVSTWQHVATVGSVPDFKAAERPQIGGFGGFDLTHEGAEHSSRPVTEDRAQLLAQTRGRIISISRQMVINDQLALGLDLSRRLGVAAGRQVNNSVYAYLTSGSGSNGPVLTDGSQLFNAVATTTAGGHANLAGTGAAISATTLAAAKLAMRRQTDRDSTAPLGIRPRALIVPEALAEAAWGQAGIATWGTNDKVDAALASAGRLQVVAEPALDSISATAWYLAADPNVAPLLEVGFLNGQTAPTIENTVGWDGDNVLFKARLDFGVVARDFRGGYRNAGA